MTIGYRKFETRNSPLTPAGGAQFVSLSLYNRYGKRMLDILIVALALPAVMPLIVIFAVLVMSDGRNPFYFQERVGRGNKRFRMWKLRSMVPDAKQALETLLESDLRARREWETDQKLKNDPRVTPIGSFIRKFSIDELPQVWNVLRGDMSIVGPRPMMVEQRELYPGLAYYSMRPGITGLWQVSNRSKCSFAARSEFDAVYAKSLSAKTDLVVMMSTVKVVLQGTGC